MNLPVQRTNEDEARSHGNGSSSLGNLWVAMFDHDLNEPNSDDALVSLQPKGVSKGRFRSDIEFPVHTFTPTNLTSECLGLWILLFDETHVLAKNCIRAHPFWMEESMDVLKDRSVKDIMIPGTHNAGSYDIGFKSDARSILKKYVTCQVCLSIFHISHSVVCVSGRVGLQSAGVWDQVLGPASIV